MKYSIGQEVYVMKVDGDLELGVITGAMEVRRGMDLKFEKQFAYIIDDLEVDMDQMYVDVNIKLYHEDCIYLDKKDFSEKGEPMFPSLKKAKEEKEDKDK